MKQPKIIYDFKVSDIVKVKSWDGMVEEFGLTKDEEYIECYALFAKAMKCYCNKIFEITDIEKSTGRVWLKPFFKNEIFDDDFGLKAWIFSTPMLIPYIPSELEQEAHKLERIEKGIGKICLEGLKEKLKERINSISITDGILSVSNIVDGIYDEIEKFFENK